MRLLWFCESWLALRISLVLAVGVESSLVFINFFGPGIDKFDEFGELTVCWLAFLDVMGRLSFMLKAYEFFEKFKK